MVRHTRHSRILDSDSDEEAHAAGRPKRKVNYAAVEQQLDDIFDDDEELAPQITDEEEVPRRRARPQFSDDEAITPKRNRGRPRKVVDDHPGSEGEYQESEAETPDEESDEEFLSDDLSEQRRIERNFVVNDEDDDYDYGRPPKRKRGRPRKVLLEDEDGEELSLAQELRELRHDTETASPPSRALRERNKEIDYTIPPPLMAVEELGAAPQAKRGRGRPPLSSGFKSLFPTAGPFGGGDVISVFSRGVSGVSALDGALSPALVPPIGTSIGSALGAAGTSAGSLGGAGANGTALAAGGATAAAGNLDSDSSDDEILPLGQTSIKPHKPKKSKKEIADLDPLGVDMNIDFSSIGGLDNYINQLKEMVALPLLYPEVYQRFGITPPRGVLFHGPPGTGKTLMARALAASCSTETRKITFFMRKGADVLSKWVGEAERQLRLLFEEAKKHQPSIIFFDEIDGLAPVRSSKQEQIHASIVSTMLALMDGMDNRGQVIVIGATNRPDAVDPALRRPGRFDREFYFPLPDVEAREQILKIHTKKWDPPLDPAFVSKLSELTKGYGGADLRALCTEAALNSIQRSFPQIYQTREKLLIDPSEIHVVARDFMKALERIVPSSARSTSSSSAPIPDHLVPLLDKQFSNIKQKLDELVPHSKKSTALNDALRVDPSEQDPDGGFARQEFMKRIESARVCRPRFLVTGPPGNGQQYIGAAVLNHLEGYHVQPLDLGTLFGESSRTIEAAIVQIFIEARRHQPSIIYVPNVDVWAETVPASALQTLGSLLRSIGANEKVMMLALADKSAEELQPELRRLFDFRESLELARPSTEQRLEFFNSLSQFLKMDPSEFKTKKRRLRKLPLAPVEKISHDTNEKNSIKDDMRLKNTLKIKLSGLLDLFKNRYKKFRKPPIDYAFLIHLFEENYQPGVPPAYVQDQNMLLEVGTGKRYFNMELDTVEERLWNGFYSEPKQFLKDIELMYMDSVTLGDRDRLIKASEMYANAQVGVEEIATPEFARQCKQMHARERVRLAKAAAQAAAEASAAAETHAKVTEAESQSQNECLDAVVHGGQVDLESVVEKVEQNIMDENIQSVEEVQSMDVDLPEDTKSEPQTEIMIDSAQIDSTNIDADKISVAIADDQEVPCDSPAKIPSNELTEESSSTDQIHELPSIEPDEIEQNIEDEPSSEEESHGEFNLDDERLGKAISSLVSSTENFTVEELEHVNAQVMEVAWNSRFDWDKTEALLGIENLSI